MADETFEDTNIAVIKDTRIPVIQRRIRGIDGPLERLIEDIEILKADSKWDEELTTSVRHAHSSMTAAQHFIEHAVLLLNKSIGKL